jgi:DNA-binding XRE family transcriptional regulator
MPQIKRKHYLKLRYYRSKYGISQKHFSILLGIKENTYSHKEVGFSPFKADELFLIHEAFNKLAKKAGDAPLTLDDIFLDR